MEQIKNGCSPADHVHKMAFQLPIQGTTNIFWMKFFGKKSTFYFAIETLKIQFPC